MGSSSRVQQKAGILILLATVAFLVPAASPAADWYVANSGNGSAGTSWTTAYTNVQTALDAAQPNDTIYLKGETFRLPINSSNGRLVWQKSSLNILGGYAADGVMPGGLSMTPTVLTVDTNSGSFETNRILYVNNVTNGTLSNVTISGGRAAYSPARDDPMSRNGYGAGLFVQNSTNMLFASVTFSGNFIATRRSSHAYGAGAYLTSSWGTFTNCLFINNSIGNNYPDSTMYLCGAGLAIASGGWTVRDCILRDNRIVDQYGYANIGRGLGLYVESGVHTIKNCAITHNVRTETSTVQGDGIYVANGTVVAENCTVDWHGFEGIRQASGSLTVKDSIVWDCGNDIAGTVTLLNSDIQDGDSGTGCISQNPLFERGLYLATNSPCVNAGSQSAAAAGLDSRTTRPDGTVDSSTVDMGYHFNSTVTDYYVSVSSGLDSNSGTDWANAFRTLTKALSVAGNGSHIAVASGTYATNTETFPLSVANKYGVQILGTNRNTTVINAKGANARGLMMTFNYPDARIEELTLTGASLTGTRAGGGLYVTYSQGNINSCIMNSNSLPNPSGWGAGAGAGIYAAQCDMVISNCLVQSNTVTAWYPENGDAAGVYAYDAGTLVNCTIADNVSSVSGDASWRTIVYSGGIHLNNTTMKNCLVYGNNATNTTEYSTSRGAGIYSDGGAVVLVNCTIVTNKGQGVCQAGGTLTLTNCIVWGNRDDVTGTVSLAYCDIMDGDSSGVNGNISRDPLFKNSGGNDFRLGGRSPCINAGINQSWMTLATDLEGKPRLAGGKVDMGAYERLSSGAVYIIR